MLALRTSADWTAAQLTVDEGGGAQTYTFAAGENSAYDAMVAVVAWATTTFAGTYSWSYATDSTTRGTLLTFASTNAHTLVANAAAQTLLGFSASYGSATSHVAAAAAAGTWHPALALSIGNWQRSLGDGMASGVEATRPGVPGLAATQPVLQHPASKLEASRLVSASSVAANPRKGWLYQSHIDGGTWRLCSVGQVDIGPGATLFPVSIELRG